MLITERRRNEGSVDLRERTFEWELLDERFMGVRLSEGDSPVGYIYSPSNLKPLALAEVAGIALKIAWTESAFYRVALTDTGQPVGEARYLPWRRDTFQARLGGLRAYNLRRESPEIASWQLGPETMIRFSRSDAGATAGSIAVDERSLVGDTAPLLALGVLLAARGELYGPAIGARG